MKKNALRKIAGLTAALSMTAGLLAGCAYAPVTSAPTESAAPAAEASEETAEEPVAVAIDKEAFDELIASGAVADDADIAASTWATRVKDAGVLRVGGTRMSFLFKSFVSLNTFCPTCFYLRLWPWI